MEQQALRVVLLVDSFAYIRAHLARASINRRKWV